MLSESEIINSKKFNLINYKRLINKLKKLNYKFVNFKHFKSSKCIILRHDVDFSMEYARKIAEVDKKLNVKSHFFFLYDSIFYNLLSSENIKHIKFIKNLGHSIGIHVNAEKNSTLINNEIKYISKFMLSQKCMIDNIFTIHKYGSNKKKLKVKNFKNFYSRPYSYIYYADSGGSFRFGSPFTNTKITNQKKSFQLNLHPIWWISKSSKQLKIKSIKNNLFEKINTELKTYKLLKK